MARSFWQSGFSAGRVIEDVKKIEAGLNFNQDKPMATKTKRNGVGIRRITMQHTQEQLSGVLNKQWQRGYDDAMSANAFGHHDESTSYPNANHPDITRSTAHDAYKQGWDKGRAEKGK